MIRPFGENEHLASLSKLLANRRSNHVRARRILCEMCKHRLNRCVGRDAHRCGEPLREHLERMRRIERQTRRVPHRSA